MSKPARIILLIAVTLTAIAFVHDYIYDKPSQPYTLYMYVVEILVTGTLFVGVIFSLLYCVYYLFSQVFRLIKSR